MIVKMLRVARARRWFAVAEQFDPRVDFARSTGRITEEVLVRLVYC